MQNDDRFVINLFRDDGGSLLTLNLSYFEGFDWQLGFVLGKSPTHCTFFSYTTGRT